MLLLEAVVGLREDHRLDYPLRGKSLILSMTIEQTIGLKVIVMHAVCANGMYMYCRMNYPHPHHHHFNHDSLY